VNAQIRLSETAGIFAVALLLLASPQALGEVTDRIASVPFGPWASGEVKMLADGARSAAAQEAFWQRVRQQGTPVIERDPADPQAILVTFVVRAPGGYRNPVPSIHGALWWHGLYPLEHVPTTDIWMRTMRFPAATRAAYWLAWPRGRVADPDAIDIYGVFAVPGSPAQEVFIDPLARLSAPYLNSFSGDVSRYSWFEGPDAAPEPYLQVEERVPRGRLETRVVASALLGNSRDVTIYTPPGYRKDRARDYPLLLMFDRDEYIATVQVPRLLDAMIDAKAVPPLVAVFVDVIGHEERIRELPGNPAFQEFVHDELLPPLDREFGLTRNPARRVVAGASYGGLCATLLARRYPGTFGAVISQSGSLGWGPVSARASGASRAAGHADLAELFAEEQRLPIRFSIDVGLLESKPMLNGNRHFRDVVRAKGYEVDYAEFVGPHDWIAWRGTLPDRLVAVLGAPRK
jgi:enterochelin esterase family protein